MDGVNPGSLIFEEEFAPGKFQTQQFGAKGAEVVPIIGTVISQPFKFFKRAIKKTNNKIINNNGMFKESVITGIIIVYNIFFSVLM